MTSSYFIKKVQNNLILNDVIANNSISLIIGDGESIIGVTKKFFISVDEGITWKEEEMPDGLYVKPVAFWGKEKVWTYCGTGYIQTRR